MKSIEIIKKYYYEEFEQEFKLFFQDFKDKLTEKLEKEKIFYQDKKEKFK